MADRMHDLRAAFLCHLRQHIGAAAAPQDQPRSLGPQSLVQAGKAVMQPPAGCATHRPLARAFIIKDIERNDRAGLRGGGKRRLIRKAQILPEPDYGGGWHDRPMPA